MTFKAVFLNFWPSANPDIVSKGAKSGGFGLQHTDFARRCQRFAALSGGMPQGRNGPILWALSATSAGEFDRLGVVAGEIDGKRELPGFQPRPAGQMDKVSGFRHDKDGYSAALCLRMVAS